MMMCFVVLQGGPLVRVEDFTKHVCEDCVWLFSVVPVDYDVTVVFSEGVCHDYQ